MSGCYGNTPEDRHFEAELNKYLATFDDDFRVSAMMEMMYESNVRDINGTFTEAFSEASDADKKRISDLILADETPAINEEIGCLFRDLVEGYCAVSEAEAIAELPDMEDGE